MCAKAPCRRERSGGSVMSSKSKSRGLQRSFVQEDSLADVKPLVLAEFEDPGEEAVEIVLGGAARMDRSVPYRERLMCALRWYIRCDDLPRVAVALNKRILAAADKKDREAAAMAGLAPRCDAGMACRPAGKVATHGVEAVRD